ncbi:MAG: M60 family metallopeptidase [Bacteroidales bacterium]|nr:M60 family metallopeptidase [Bacteroidales bacterium]
MNKIVKILSMLVVAVALLACARQQGETAGIFRIASENLSLTLDQERLVYFVPVTTDIPESEWRLTSSEPDWCQPVLNIGAEKGFLLVISANDDPEPREATVIAKAQAYVHKLRIQQLGYGPAIIVSDLIIPAEGGNAYLKVASNIAYQVGALQLDSKDGADWIVAAEEKTKAFAEDSYTYVAQTNALPYKRMATLEITATDSQYSSASKQVKITQNTMSDSIDDMITDTRIPVLTVRANQQSAHEGPVENLIDDNYGSYYHSPWESETPPTTFPVELEFEFAGDARIDYMYITHRGAYNAEEGTFGAGNATGRIGVMKIYTKAAAGDAYQLLAGDYDLHHAGGRQQVYFETPLQGVKWVKLSVEDGSYNLVTPAEVEFYNSNAEDLNGWIEKIFTDLSCTKLRSGVTLEDIVKMNAVAPVLAKRVAVPLLEGTYGKEGDKEFEFRAWNYEAYSDNNLNKDIVIKKYTRMDNPTGIEVKAGEDIVVCVDQIPAGQTVSLAVYGDQGKGVEPNYGSMSELSEGVDQAIALHAGLNIMKANANGMLYVWNIADTYSSASKPVKVHIVPGCGTVQGYFDLARHDDARYKELLAANSYTYFAIKGAKAMLLFHTAQLKKDAPDAIVSGIKAWDQFVAWEHELLGLSKFPYNNHMMVVSSTAESAYMDAGTRRVRLGIGAIGNLLTEDGLYENAWGPAHELGHLNQTAICWESTIESSNNLFSNYVRYKVGREASRGEKLSVLGTSYAAGMPWVRLGNFTQYQNEDAELHMRMNWQLWNYYHRLGNKEDFFQKLFQLLREDPLPSEFGPLYFGVTEDPGACQLKFYQKVCEAAGQDLTEFFDAWGFFRPFDEDYKQYANEARTNLIRYTVTSGMISNAKAAVAAKGYPKAAPIQYLEDRTAVGGEKYADMGYYETFQKGGTVTAASYTLNGRAASVSGCENAVAVEVRARTSDGSLGALRYFSNLYDFNVPDKVDLATSVFYAVQADGERKLMTKK